MPPSLSQDPFLNARYFVGDVPPPNPPVGQCVQYFSSADGLFHVIDSTGASVLPGGSGSPGGTDTAVQFNNAGTFGGNANNFSYDDATQSLLMENGGASTVIQIVAGAHQSMDITLDATQSPPFASLDNVEPGGTINIFADGLLQLISQSDGVVVGIGGNKISFFGAAPQVKATINGSRGSNAALASLIGTLRTMGLIFDGTSP